MAVIQPRFDPTQDRGAPAFLSFWSGFLGQRSAINQQIMKERMQQEDPTKLMAMEQAMRQNASDLIKTKADLLEKLQKGRTDLTTAKYALLERLIAAEGQIAVARINGTTNMKQTQAQITADIAKTLYEYGATNLNKANQASAEVGKYVSSAFGERATGGSAQDRARTYNTKLDGLIGKARYTDADKAPQRDKTIAMAIDQIAVHDPEAAAVLKKQNGIEGDTDAWLSEKYRAVPFEDAQKMAEESVGVLSTGGGADYARLFKMAGLTEDPEIAAVLSSAPVPTAQSGQYRDPKTGQVSGVSVTTETKGPKGAISDALSGINKQIEDLNKQADELKLQRESIKPKSVFSGFMSNALYEPLFTRPPKDKEAVHQAFMMMDDDERSMVSQALEQAGGDVNEALKLIQQGIPPVEPTIPTTEPAPSQTPEEPAAAPESTAASVEQSAVRPSASPKAAVIPQQKPTPTKDEPNLGQSQVDVENQLPPEPEVSFRDEMWTEGGPGEPNALALPDETMTADPLGQAAVAQAGSQVAKEARLRQTKDDLQSALELHEAKGRTEAAANVRVKIDAIDSMLEDVQASKRSFEEITGMAPEQVTEGFAANAFSMPPETRQSGLPRVEAARQVLALRGRPAKWIIDTVPNAGQIEGLAAYLSQREEMEMLRAKTPQTDSTSQRIGELKPKVEAFEAQLEQMASYQKPLEAAQRFSTGVQ